MVFSGVKFKVLYFIMKKKLKILGRKNEIKKLQRFLESTNPQFLALYGRRRVGKTFLIRSFFSKTDVVLFEVTGRKSGNKKLQLRSFVDSFQEIFKVPVIGEISSWAQAFKLITAYVEEENEKKIVVFLDELPWLAGKDGELLRELDYVWNSKWSKFPNFKLIICGSSASWIIDKIISDKGGFHNRLTARINLQPFLLATSKEFLIAQGFKLTNRQIVDLYIILGGVPYYLSLLDPQVSIGQNIDNLVFKKDGELYQEYNLLFSSLFDDSELHSSIVNELSLSRNGLEIEVLAEKLQVLRNGSLTRALKQLEEAGFVRRYIPYGKQRRNGFYRLIDEYSFFYNRFIKPTVHRSIGLSENYWVGTMNSQKYYTSAGYSFETLCHKHYHSILRALQISGIQTSVHSWQYNPKIKRYDNMTGEGSGAQIDMLFDRADSLISLCEIKYTSKPYTMTKADYSKLKHASAIFAERTKTKKQLNWILISAEGARRNAYLDEVYASVLDVDSLFL